MKYELEDHLPKVKRKEGPEMVKITITVPRKDIEDIDKAVRLCGREGDTPTAYGKASVAVAAERARELLSKTKVSEGSYEYKKCSE